METKLSILALQWSYAKLHGKVEVSSQQQSCVKLQAKLEASSQQRCSNLQAKLGDSLLRGCVKLQAKLTFSSWRSDQGKTVVLKSFKAKLDKLSMSSEASPLGSCETKC